MKKIVYLLIIIVFFSSCSCLKKGVISENDIKLNKSNLSLLNGKYKRYSGKPKKDSVSAGDLYWNFYANTYKHIFGIGDELNYWTDTSFVELKVINTKKILVLYIDGNDTIKSHIVRGKIKDGYFEFNRKYLFMTILLVNLYRDSKFRIKLSQERDLIGDFKEISFGILYGIIPFYDKETEYSKIYKRIENNTENNAPNR